MRKITPIKGTELRGTRTFVPGAEYGPAEPNLAGRLYGPNPVYAPNTIYAPPGGEVDYESLWVAPIDGFLRNLYGMYLSLYDVARINPAFSAIVAPMYPGSTLDDNDIQWEVPVPVDMDPVTPDITVRLHFLIPE